MKNLRSIFAFILREVATSYGRHPGGFLWSFLEPIAGIALLTIVFSLALRSPALGDNFALFYATGYLPFVLYSNLAAKLAQTIKYSRQLLKYPVVNFADALIARFLLNLFIHLIVTATVIIAIVQIGNIRQPFDFPQIYKALLMAAALAFGVGTVNCYFTTRFPIWERVWAIINRPAFIVSGVFFTYESVPEPFRSYLWYNPLIHVTGAMRQGFYPSYDAIFVSEVYTYSIAGLSALFGILILGRTHRHLINSL